MWTASLGQDFDLDLANQAERLGPLNTYMAVRNPATGRYGNAFPWGLGLVMQPAFWAARALDRLPAFRINDEWFLALQAYPFAYSLTGMLQTNLMTLASLVLAYGLARRLGAAPLPSAAGALCAVWGTPLYYYSSVEPLFAHAAAACLHTGAIALAAWAGDRPAGRRAHAAALLAGLVFGLATLTRWQLALSAGIFVLWLAGRRQVGPAAALALGWALLAWHIPYSLNGMFGSLWAVPADAVGNGHGFLGAPRYLIPLLFAPDRGWLVWSPLAAVGLAGLGLWGRRGGGLPAALLLTVAAQVLLAAGVRDWYAGESFGQRRLTELYPAVAIGLAAVLDAAGRRRPAAWAAYAAVGGLALASLGLVAASLVFHYFSAPEFGFVAAAPPASLENVWRFLLADPPKLDLIWPMMEHHFGPWAWTWPGP